MCTNQNLSNRVATNHPAFNVLTVLIFSVLLLVQHAIGEITMLNANYKVEPFAQYQLTASLGITRYITTDSSGGVYISHDKLVHVTSDGSVSVLPSSFNNPQGITWGGGTSYDNFLYVTEAGTGSIKKVDSAGNVTTFRSLPEDPLAVVIDRYGNFGNKLYAGTWNSTILYSITESGGLSEFVDISALTDGNPCEITFDPTGRYNGYMYMTLWDVHNPNYQGILSIDPARQCNTIHDNRYSRRHPHCIRYHGRVGFWRRPLCQWRSPNSQVVTGGKHCGRFVEFKPCYSGFRIWF